MHKYQPPQILELSNSEIPTLCRSHTLIAINTNPNMRFQYHRNIIASIANTQCNSVLIIVLNQPDNVRFLARRHPAANHSFTGLGDLQESSFVLLVF